LEQVHERTEAAGTKPDGAAEAIDAKRARLQASARLSRQRVASRAAAFVASLHDRRADEELRTPRPGGRVPRGTVALPWSLSAQTASSSSVRPAAYVIGTSEQGQWRSLRSATTSFEGTMRSISGSARRQPDLRWRAPRRERLRSHPAMPPSSPDWGFFAAGRVRAAIWREGGPWIFRIEDAPLFSAARRWALQISEERLWEKPSIRHGPGTWGSARGSAPFGSRRRRPGLPIANLSPGFLTAGSGSPLWRLEAGPQRYSTTAGEGWRLAAPSIRRRLQGTSQHTAFPLARASFGPSKGGMSAGVAPTDTPTPTPTPMPRPRHSLRQGQADPRSDRR